ncbi:LAME_0H06084g1_1 [Lachancea meyersii CBS 8951]|uniref:LAME_0H06084g1_1 n=1 Tax=Lachancea meyersii CBS 8951 TaxID=1266667 RepID=A0A1G4KEV6_9SACH|nr:LAME_0H06084g1_1 [Lachancea meyersii CBS 8951]
MSVSSNSAVGGAVGGANGLLEVYVSRARDLPNLRKLDKQSPFVRLRISHMIATSEVAFRGGQTPKFDFYSKFDLTPDVKPALVIELFDERSPPRLIGQCTVDLTPALYKDPEDGHDDWFDLKMGKEEAGQVYVELTFHPLIPTTRLRKKNSDYANSLELAMEGREPPPLPSKLPSFRMGDEYNAKSYNGYSHASESRSSSIALDSQEPIVRPNSNSRNSINFTSSVASNGTFSSHATSASHESHATVNTVGTATSAGTEPLFAKLRQLKEKWKSIKNPASDQQGNDNENKLDLKALQKVVGVDPEDYEGAATATRSPSRKSFESSKLASQPPLPRLPVDQARRTSAESSPRAMGRFASSIREQNPPLPPLPPSPLSKSGTRSRNASNSPTRRRPPPLD